MGLHCKSQRQKQHKKQVLHHQFKKKRNTKMASYVDMAIQLIENKKVQGIVTEGAKLVYTDLNNVSINLVPALIATVLGMLMFVPLISYLTGLKDTMDTVMDTALRPLATAVQAQNT